MTRSVTMTQNTAQSPAGISARACRLFALTLLPLLACLASAQDSGDLQVLDLSTPLRLNFSGAWEKDFRRSDSWEAELNRMMRLRQEQAARQRSGSSGGGGPAVSLGNINLNSRRGRGASIVDLARLAEYISRQTTLQIIQNRNEVRIERTGEAPLICSLEDGPTNTFSSVHGAEVCGWDKQQLVFRTNLPDDIQITHRFTVSSNNAELRMVISITSRSSAPFNLIQAFNRYEAPVDQFNCVQTISRGRVCSLTSTLD
jgi:hypothetical protein